MKIRSYLILMAVVIVIPVAFFSLAGLDMLIQQERQSRLVGIEETARATALAIDREIAYAEGRLTVLANTNAIETGDFDLLYGLMLKSQTSEDSANAVFNQMGGRILNTRVPFGAALSGSSYADVPRIIAAKKLNVSNFRIGLSDRPVVSIDIPVETSKGNKYVVSQTFDTAHFNSLLGSSELSKSWVIGLFGSDGISIARNMNHELVGKPVRSALYLASQQSFSGRLQQVTRESVAVYSVFTHTGRTGWTVALGVPVEEIEAPARRAALLTALAMALTFALGALVVLLLAKQLTRAVEGVLTTAKSLGKGEMPEVNPSRVVEVDLLQKALHDAGTALVRENSSRLSLEREREALLLSEKAARNEAEIQNRAKDDFLAMLGHELRNPLAPISAAAQILTMAASDDKRIRQCGDIIGRQVKHMTELVNDLLDVSRVTRGLVELDKSNIDIADVIAQAIEQARPLLQARHHELISNDLTTSHVQVYGDRTRLIQVISNLLNNAAKYTPEGGRIEVAVELTPAQVSISVRDNGAGIEPTLLPRVFDLFTQAERTPDRSQGGLGLGLALVKSIMALHGGRAEASSEGLGKGSTFTIYLERNEPPVEQPAADALLT